MDDGLRVWKAAVYIRLSQDDKESENTSDSVINQEKIVRQFATQHTDIDIFDVYTDDGYTGTNFNRPGFKRMMADINAGKISCVIVKDLSRLGREYLSVGNYLEQIFPSLGIRFISIMQSIDTYKNPKRMIGLEVPFLSLINEQYAIDISNKTRTSLQAKQKAGKYVGVHIPYGYLRHPEDKNKLIDDPDVSHHVKAIFKLYIGGQSMNNIAESLNQQGILSPLGHFVSTGLCKLPKSSNPDTYHQWTGSKVHNILKNPLYTGDLVQGTTTSYSHKVKKRLPIPKEQWIIVKNTHEALISHSTYELAQELLSKDIKPVSKKAEPSLFAGILTCADCGCSMVRNISSKNGVQYCNYLCSNYKKHGSSACSSHFVNEDVIKAVVLNAIQWQIKVYRDIDGLKQKASSVVDIDSTANILNQKLKNLQSKLDKTAFLVSEADKDYSLGILDQQEYQYMQGYLSEQREALSKKQLSLRNQLNEKRTENVTSNEILAEFLENGEIKKLTRSFVVHLVEEILVYQDKSINIKFKFKNNSEKSSAKFEKTTNL